MLSPIMLFFKWASFKKVSGITSLFILVNSISSIGGILSSGAYLPLSIFLWILIAIVAALIGPYWGSRKAPVYLLKKVLATILLIASVKLLLL